MVKLKPSYPILTEEEMGIVLKQLELRISVKDLAVPSPESAQAIYQSFYTYLNMPEPYIVHSDSVPFLSDIMLSEDVHTHTNSLPFYTYFFLLKQLLSACAVKDFSLKDLSRPGKVRLTHHTSAITNFLRFEEEQTEALVEMLRTSESVRGDLDEAQGEIARLEGELYVLGEAAEVGKAASVELDQELASVAGETAELGRQFAGLTEAHDAVLADIKLLDREEKALDSQIAAVEDDVLRAKGRIIDPDAPARLVETLQRHEAGLLRLTDEQATLEQKVGTYEVKIREAARYRDELGGATELLQALSEKVSACKLQQAERESLSSEISHCITQESELAQRLQSTQRDIQACKEKLAPLTGDASHAFGDREQEFKQAHSRRELLLSQLQQVKDLRTGLEEKLEDSNRRHRLQQKTYSTLINTLTEKTVALYQAFLAQLSAICTRISDPSAQP